MIKELMDFLSQFESASAKIIPTINREKNDKWNEIRVPTFRNFKVFVHQTNGKMMIVIPTHVSGIDEVHYHVITEDLDNDNHNGDYKRMSQERFKATYDCNFTTAEQGTIQTTKIADLADMMVNMLPEIKDLKTETEDDKTESSLFFGQIILEFLMKSSGKKKD